MSNDESASNPNTGTVRKLWTSDANQFSDHLLRLDSQSRRMRFAHGASDGFIRDYAERMHEPGAVTFAYIEKGEVRAAAELKPIGGLPGSESEVALSVETSHQDRGLGTRLFGRLIQSARNRGVHRLQINCLTGNHRMRALARKFEAQLRLEDGQLIGVILPEGSGYFSMLEEAFDDRTALVLSFMDMQSRFATATKEAMRFHFN